MANGDSTGGATFPIPRYLRDLTGLYMRMFQAQSDRAQSVLERMAGGEYKADDWVKDASQFWSNLVLDGIRACESVQQSAAGDSVPTSVFILDEPAGGADPKTLPIAVRLQQDAPVVVSSFSRVDHPGGPGIDAKHFEVELDPTGSRLLLKPRDIGAIDPGHYLGWVYVQKPGAKLPVAAVHLVKLDPPAS